MRRLGDEFQTNMGLDIGLDNSRTRKRGHVEREHFNGGIQSVDSEVQWLRG